jgi:hypothetical protein
MRSTIIFLVVLSTVVAGCQHIAEPPVATQAVGVASSPLGAKVYVDGIEKGVTPTTVVLEKNRDHLISIVKDGWEPLFVPVNHRIDEARLSLEALRSGVRDARFWKDASQGFDSAVNVYEVNERTGQYNNLFPTNVTVTLKPLPQNEQEPLALQ